jgi:hypothetical protein
VFGDELQIQGSLTGASAGTDKIELVLDSAQGSAGDYVSPVCASAVCTYTATPSTIAGNWYVVPIWLAGGSVESAGTASPTVAYSG